MEGLVLFESVINSLHTLVMLFLNKVDVNCPMSIFVSVLTSVLTTFLLFPGTSLEKYFPEYTTGPDINKAAKHI